MNKFFNSFKNKYFSEDLDFRARLFNLLAISGITISFFTFIESIITQMWSTSLITLALILISWILMNYAIKSRNYKACYYITIIVIFMIFFPFLFFNSGGYHGGMPSVFIFASLFTMLMLEGLDAFIMLIIEAIIYSSISYISYLYPNLVVPFSSEKAALYDILFGYIAVSVVCGIVVFLYLKEFNKKNKQISSKNEKLKLMDEAKSTFLTTVAHEVKNPLNVISLHAQDSLDILTMDDIDIEQLKENQKIMANTVMRIDHILNDLMDTVSIEQGRLKLVKAPLLLEDVIIAASSSWKKEIQQGKIKTDLIIDIAPGLKEINADYSRIYQVIYNLLNNAFRHTKNGYIKIKLQDLANEQLICVEDNGEGMTPDIKEKALEGYVSENKDYWRHGIGLYVCNRIVGAHNGRIWIESELKKGTKVYFTLPKKED